MSAPADVKSRETEVQSLIEKCGYASAAVTLLPLPGSEILAVMPIHVGMVVKIAESYDVELTRASASQLIVRIGATVGFSLLGSRLAASGRCEQHDHQQPLEDKAVWGQRAPLGLVNHRFCGKD